MVGWTRRRSAKGVKEVKRSKEGEFQTSRSWKEDLDEEIEDTDDRLNYVKGRRI